MEDCCSSMVEVSVLSFKQQKYEGVKQRFRFSNQSSLKYSSANGSFSSVAGQSICTLKPLWGSFGLNVEKEFHGEASYFSGSFSHAEEIEVTQGDELILADLKLKVVAVYTQEYQPTPVTQSDFNVCRICSGPSSLCDPLLSLCRCSGDTKYIHYTCVRHWNHIRNRLHSGRLSVLTLNSKMCACEICNGSYLETATELVPFVICEQFGTPAVLLSLAVSDSEQRYFLVNLSETITIGKGMDATLRLSDQRLNNLHCTVRMKGGRLLVKDLNTRVGTYLRYREEIDMHDKPIITLHLQGQIIEIKAKSRLRTNEFN